MLSLNIVGNAVEGTTLKIDKMYWGGEEGDSVYRWLRVLLLSTFCVVQVFDVTSIFDLEWLKSYVPLCQCLNIGYNLYLPSKIQIC